jgi:hypothetical protein
MEKEQPHAHDRVQITQAVYEGLEFIRRSGVTNMLDRPMVLNLAKEWGLNDTADWIESVDTGTYGRLIILGPDVIGEESLDENSTGWIERTTRNERGSGKARNSHLPRL